MRFADYFILILFTCYTTITAFWDQFLCTVFANSQLVLLFTPFICLFLSYQRETERSLPSPPPLCLSLCKNQGAALLNNTSNYNGMKAERSTKRQKCGAQRSNSAKTRIKHCETQNMQGTHSNNQLLIEGGPPAVLADATNIQHQSGASLPVTRLTLESLCPPGGNKGLCSSPSSSMPTAISATQHLQTTQVDVGEGNLVIYL